MGKNLINNSFLDESTCRIIRGLMACIIVLHHLSQYAYYGIWINVILGQVGSTATVVFFFYSAYGLTLRYKQQDNYLDDFFSKRILAVLIPYLIAVAVYTSILILIGEQSVIYNNIYAQDRNVTVLPNSWFIKVIVLWYIFFYISFKFAKNIVQAIVLCSFFVVCFATFLLYFGYDSYWYSSLFVFIFGMVYGLFAGDMNAFFMKKWVIKVAIYIVAFFALIIIAGFVRNVFLLMLIKNIRAVIACMIILHFSMFIRGEHLFFSLLGDASYEIYLYHGIVLDIMAYYIRNIVFYALSVVVIIVFISILFYKMDSIIVAFIKNRKSVKQR